MNNIQASAAPAVPVVSRLLLDILIATNSPLKCKSVWMVPSVSVLLLRPRHQGTMERVGGDNNRQQKLRLFTFHHLQAAQPCGDRSTICLELPQDYVINRGRAVSIFFSGGKFLPGNANPTLPGSFSAWTLWHRVY